MCALPLAAQSKLENVTDQAEAVLAILDAQEAGKGISEADLNKLFQTEGHRRWTEREKTLKHEYSVDFWKKFLASDKLRADRGKIKALLETSKRFDSNSALKNILAYLPSEAEIKAKVYFVINPNGNSFVFEGNSIFLALDPSFSPEFFETAVLHEMHHIGMASVKKKCYLPKVEKLAPTVKDAADCLVTFGEGFAMLAAAGGVDRDPHATTPAIYRGYWEKELACVNEDAKKIEKFLFDVIEGRLKGEAINDAYMAFFSGFQGAWYTVGWRMSVAVERAYGREKLMDCMRDPRLLLRTFNSLAAKEKMPAWSSELLDILDGKSVAKTVVSKEEGAKSKG